MLSGVEVIGVHTNLSNEEYHGHKESISRSGLMDFAKSPYTYWAKHLNPDRPKREPTQQMVLGSAVHTFILEPNLFAEQFAFMPEKVIKKNSGKELYEEYKNNIAQIERLGKTILSSEEACILKGMGDKFFSNESAIELINNARIENSFFWQDQHSGLLLKARPDILHDNMIVDLKTCSNASPRAFQSSMIEGGYHIQGAMIRDAVEVLEGRRINHVINICLETKYPYNMAIYLIDEDAINAGQRKYKQLCLDLKEALETNTFPDYGIQQISLPKWAIE